MNIPIKDTVNYNSTYISLNLLDELDYYLGGYAKPNAEFIFSLNTFVESFIGCSEFYTSLDELNHLNLTAPALFPNGRPILNLVVREAGLKFVNGVVEKKARVIYTSDAMGMTKKEAQQEFIATNGKTFYNQYFLKSDLTNIVEKIPLITSKFEDGNFIVSEVLNTSTELISNLINVSNTSSIQTTLPIYLFNNQINSLGKSISSKDSLDKIAHLYEVNVEKLRKALGYQYMPIPPFTNILLSQLNSISEIPQKLSQLRMDFQQLRDEFANLEKNIFEAPSMNDQLDAYSKFTEFWRVFNKKYVEKSNRIFYGHMDIAKDIELENSIETLIDKQSLPNALEDLKITKVAGNYLIKGFKWNKERKIINRFKGLTNIWELFGKGNSIADQIKHFERLFGITINNLELKRVHDFVNKNFSNITTTIKD